MRKVATFSAVVLFFLIVILASRAALAEKKVGILLFSEDTRYVDAARGIKDKLKENGFEGHKIKIIEENAGANIARAAELVSKITKTRMDLIFSIGTPITMALAKEIRDVPIVFSTVYDPVESGIAKSWESSGNNTTGTSTKIPMSKLLDSLIRFKPVKRLSVLYTPGERQSVLVARDLQEIQSQYNMKIIAVPFTKIEDFGQMLPEVLRTSDAIYVTGSNLVTSQLSMIVDLATKATVVTITHLEDLVEKGVLLGVCADSYQVGRRAGEKGVKILKGAKPATIPIDTLKKNSVIINMKTAKAGQYQIPREFMKTVTKKIQ
jgi:putative ABC transport system substrate-binding protein